MQVRNARPYILPVGAAIGRPRVTESSPLLDCNNLNFTFLSLRGGRKRSARRGTGGNTFRCNLLVPPIEMYSSIETLYREIATSLRSSQ